MKPVREWSVRDSDGAGEDGEISTLIAVEYEAEFLRRRDRCKPCRCYGLEM